MVAIPPGEAASGKAAQALMILVSAIEVEP
jgi:hypothetical protein